MYLLKLTLIPTSALLFRKVPFATTVFPTYPFVPPTVLAGFLRRLIMLANDRDLPGDISPGRGTLNSRAKFYTLPPSYICLGAYPTTYTMHRTKRHQPWGAAAKFNHVEFSALRREKSEINPQIPVWEYLHTARLTGYVLHAEKAPLETLQALTNWGCKIGKEGYAFVESTSEIVELQGPQRARALPATPVPAEVVGDEPADFFTLYCYEWQTSTESFDPRFDPGSELGMSGEEILLKPFLAAWIRREVEIEFYTDGEEFFPKAWVDRLQSCG